MARPPRIDRISCIGRSTYLVTTTTRDRVNAFTDLDFGRLAERALLAHACRNRFALPAYCLMPDHVHIVATGQTSDCDLRRMVAGWKQAAGFAWSKLGDGRLWQAGYWERLARSDEPVDVMVRYVIDNPVRAGLAADPTLYPLSESTIEHVWRSLPKRRH